MPPSPRPEADGVLHSWCVPEEWDAPTVVGGSGAWLHLEDGRRLLDLSALSECSLLGHQHPRLVLQAARRAWPAWRAHPAAERVALLRRVAALRNERVHALAAALALEVGKNRMEALGAAQETADFGGLLQPVRRRLRTRAGLRGRPARRPDCRRRLPQPLAAADLRRVAGDRALQPFNYPLALLGGPTAAALVGGNVGVAKGSPHTPWAGRLLADCLRDAGVPAGVFQWLHSDSHELGRTLAAHPDVAGITFTGSVAVGRELLAQSVCGRYPRPCIAEMGGKNACIVSARADLDVAAAGIVRSAYGLSGQKCSALSRLYVHASVAVDLIERLRAQTAAITVGDPTERRHWMGPVKSAAAQARYVDAVAQLRAGGATLHAGGEVLRDGALAHGHYVSPLLAQAPAAHPLWRQELFLPLLLLQRVAARDEAMQRANDSDLGLSAGFYGGVDEVAWFHEHIEAGVTYANRAQGTTTGTWPGYQPFGGWKDSGSTGKAIASFHDLPLYLREQSQTVVV